MKQLLAGLVLWAAVAQPAAAAFRTVHHDARMSLQVDEATLETRGMTAKLWVRQVFVRPEQASPGDFFFKSMTQLQQFACDKRTVTPLLTVYYDVGDAEMRRINGDDKAQPVVPGSFDEQTFNIGCRIKAASSGTPTGGSGGAPEAKGGKAATAKPAAAKPAAKPEVPASMAPVPVPARGGGGESEDAQLRGLVKQMLDDNAAWMKTHGFEFYRPVFDGQYPRATVVTCADSQLHVNAFDATPEGDLYVVRNLGNQLATNAGSIDYGVRKLKTPLLIFVGHTACSAVKLATTDFSAESRPLRRELENLRLDKKLDITQNVVLNVNNQVNAARDSYATEVKLKKLVVLGAVFDHRNDLGQGYGKLVFVDANGETDPKKVAAWLAGVAGKSEVKSPAKPAAKKPAAPKKKTH